MEDMFGDVNKSISEGSTRWKLIEELASNIKEGLDDSSIGGDILLKSSTGTINPHELARLLVLLVEHMKPMNPSEGHLDDMVSGIQDLMSSSGKK